MASIECYFKYGKYQGFYGKYMLELEGYEAERFENTLRAFSDRSLYDDFTLEGLAKARGYGFPLRDDYEFEALRRSLVARGYPRQTIEKWFRG